MIIKIKDKTKRIHLSKSKKISEILEENLKINPEIVIVKKNGILVPIQDKADNNSKLELFYIISGG